MHKNHNVMVIGREKSVVHFQTELNNGDGNAAARTGSKDLLPVVRRKSDLRNVHRYIPRLHRQQTELPPESLIGAALKAVAQTRCREEELFSLARTSARGELKEIIDRSFVSLSRNSFGVQFLEPVHLLGFAHWQAYPEKKVVCFLPLHIPKLKSQPGDPGAVFVKLPRLFNSHISLTPADLQSDNFSGRYLSSKKFFSLVIKLLKRILAFKSVPQERIRSSETHGVLEVDLLDSIGWTGEIVICLAIDRADTTFYCGKPFYYPPQNILSCEHEKVSGSGDHVASNNENMTYESFRKTPRAIDSVQSNFKTPQGNTVTYSTNSGGHHQYIYNEIRVADNVASLHSALDGRVQTAATAISGVTFADRSSTVTHTPIAASQENEDENFNEEEEEKEEHTNDVTWYACQPRSENNLVRSISATDNGIRLTALLVVFRLLQHDWRLLPFTCYHVQVAMLHETEQALDTSPRWQRRNLESCVRSLLGKLRYFVAAECLPHFCVCHVDLWLWLSPGQLALAKSALHRLVCSDTALLSLVRRTARLGVEDIEATTRVHHETFKRSDVNVSSSMTVH